MEDFDPKENEKISGQSEKIDVGGLEKPAVSYDTFDKFAQEIRKEFKELKDDTQKIRTEFKDEINKQIQMDKASLMTVFGVFASILAFLTVEFHILTALNNLQQIVGFSLILFALLLGFNIALDYLMKSHIDKEIPVPKEFIGLAGLIFCLGLPFILWGNKENDKIYQKNSDFFENKLSDFQSRYDQKNEILDSRIKLLDEKIDFRNKAIELKTSK